MSVLGMFKTVARTELKELVPDVSDETLLYLNRAIQAAYDLGQSERDVLSTQLQKLQHSALELHGVIVEYEAMPTKCLANAMFDTAKRHWPRINPTP